MKSFDAYKEFDNFEEYQKNLNNRLNIFKDSTSGKDRERLDAVDKAVEILQKADVPFTAFFHVKHPNSVDKDRAIQYNNYADTIKRRNKDPQYINYLSSEFVYSVLSIVISWLEVQKIKDKIDIKDRLNYWVQTHLKFLKQWEKEN